MNYKSGIKSTELYTSLISQIFGFLVVIGFFTPTEATELQGLATSIIGGIISVVALVVYIKSRVSHKETVLITEALKGIKNGPTDSQSLPEPTEIEKELEKAILG